MVDRPIAMVATRDAAIAAPKAVLRALAPMLGPDDGAPVMADSDAADGGGYVVTIGSSIVAVLPFPFGIPTATLATAIGQEYVWKTAGDVFLASGGHFLVSVVNPPNDPSERFEQARVLTLVTRAVLIVAKGVGVFWQPADCVIPPERFIAESKTVATDSFASPLWFSVRFFPVEGDTNSALLVCQSKGLADFLGREIECGPYAMTPGDLAHTVLTTARFMATSGPVFADGHSFSFGKTGKTDARLIFDWSALGGVERPIFQLRLSEQEAKA